METEIISQGFISGLNNITFHALTPGIIFTLIVTICLLISSALVSGSEVAFFSLKPQDLKDLKEHRSKKNNLILRLLERPESLLATILIANNFVNVAIVILASFILSALVSFNANLLLGFLVEVIFITALLLFFGEILPKIYAAQSSRIFAEIMAYPMLVLKKIFNPIATLLVKSSNIVNKRIAKHAKSISMADISQALELTGDDISEEKEILEGIVKFGNIDVNEIMTARVDVVDLDITSDFNKVLSVIIESGYSRIPVFKETPDNVKGVLYIKDLLPHLSKSTNFNWQNIIREAFYVPETMKINDLLAEFKDRKIHMAIVVDEYGGTSGIATMEDVIEEIVGEISDEMDDEGVAFSREPDGSYIFEGKTQLNDFHKITETDDDLFLNLRGEAETLAGLILEMQGEIPQKHEIIEKKKFSFTILAADTRRIKKVKFNLKE